MFPRTQTLTLRVEIFNASLHLMSLNRQQQHKPHFVNTLPVSYHGNVATLQATRSQVKSRSVVGVRPAFFLMARAIVKFRVMAFAMQRKISFSPGTPGKASCTADRNPVGAC